MNQTSFVCPKQRGRPRPLRGFKEMAGERWLGDAFGKVEMKESLEVGAGRTKGKGGRRRREEGG